jgi:hypothetical protein
MTITYLNAPQGAMPHGLLIFCVAFSAQKAAPEFIAPNY